MTKDIFTKASPEALGISSEDVLNYIKILDGRRMHLHAILMARGENIFAEGYYKPFHEIFLHRMYSVSKSFVAIAVGLAVTEGLFSLDDAIINYFPEYRNENTDAYYEACTVRDMLKMQSNVGTGVYWWGKFENRIQAYYSQKSDKISGGLFHYDSIGSFLLGCIIERLTGMDFLTYLKKKVLLAMGFSKESYVLREPGGYAIGDSGVMCTARDLLIFARFIMRRGEWGGKQYVDRDFMEDAIQVQSPNDLNGTHALYETGGYGYLIWKTHPDGFSLVGMGDQLAICDAKHDLCLVILADNQAAKCQRHIIFHEFYEHFLPKLSAASLPSNKEEEDRLNEYLKGRTLIAQYGEKHGDIARRFFGKEYAKQIGELDIEGFTLYEDRILLNRRGAQYTLPYGMLENKQTEFSFGERARADMMGVWEEGKYDCNVSAGWIREDAIAIMAQVTDTYFGELNLQICFKDDMATLYASRSGQYIFDGLDGFMIAKQKG